MGDNLKLQIAVLIKNILGIFAFIVLAIFFNKWWLSLLSILFLTSVEKDEENEDDEED